MRVFASGIGGRDYRVGAWAVLAVSAVKARVACWQASWIWDAAASKAGLHGPGLDAAKDSRVSAKAATRPAPR